MCSLHGTLHNVISDRGHEHELNMPGTLYVLQLYAAAVNLRRTHSLLVARSRTSGHLLSGVSLRVADTE